MPQPVSWTNWRWTIYEDLQDLQELTPKTHVLFILWDWNAKAGSQEIPGVTGKFDLGVQKANSVLQRKCTGHGKILFQQHKRRLYTWTSPDDQYWNQTDYILCSQRWRCSIQSAKTRPGADCGSDHELLIVKLRLKLKKVRKITSPFRYDINQILYNYTVKVINRFKGLDLIVTVCGEIWTEVHDIVHEAVIKMTPKRKKNAKKRNDCLRSLYK